MGFRGSGSAKKIFGINSDSNHFYNKARFFVNIFLLIIISHLTKSAFNYFTKIEVKISFILGDPEINVTQQLQAKGVL